MAFLCSITPRMNIRAFILATIPPSSNNYLRRASRNAFNSLYLAKTNHCQQQQRFLVSFKAPPRIRPEDEGDWRFSPEWWGTQGRGWGHNEGVMVFNEVSSKGNGLVTVTAHPASTPKPEEWSAVLRQLKESFPKSSGVDEFEFLNLRIVGYEWRVLRFNNETRQSVAKVIGLQNSSHPEKTSLLQSPNCLAFQYLKSLVSVGLASVSLAGLNLKLVAKGFQVMRVLCIGLGGGSLPLFLANKLKGCQVEVVEIDKTVISAALDVMGFPPCVSEIQQISDSLSEGYRLPKQEACNDARLLWGNILDRIKVFEGDGVAYICNLSLKKKPKGALLEYYDMVFVDAYDGKDEVPYHLCSRNGAFLTALGSQLHPAHGTVVVNLHTDAPPPSLMERITGKFGPGFDPLLPGGRQIQDISHAYRYWMHSWDSILPRQVKKESHLVDTMSCTYGMAYTVSVPSQQNICLVISRGIQPGDTSVVENLQAEASHIEHLVDIPFNMPQRVSRGFHFV